MTDAPPIFEPQPPAAQDGTLERLQSAARHVATWDVVQRPTSPGSFGKRIRANARALAELESRLSRAGTVPESKNSPLEPLQAAWAELRAHRRALRTALQEISGKQSIIAHLPRAMFAGGQDEPNAAALTRVYLSATNGAFSPSTFQYFVRVLQEHEPLTLDELWSLSAFLQFALLESLLHDAHTLLLFPYPETAPAMSMRLQSLQVIHRTEWTTLIEPLITFDTWLREDPAGAYDAMDFGSRQRYRQRVAMIARHSDCDEDEVAQAALDLARRASEGTFSDPRMQGRRMHVGYYLIDQGFPRLAGLVGFHPPPSQRMLQWIHAYAEDFYIGGVLVLSVLILALVLFLPLPQFAHIFPLAIACLLLLPPAMQIAVDLVNQAITALYEPEPLPKLDFSKGVPADYATLVAVPSLLLNEKQVHELVTNLEVRFLANRDPHVHFALLTDLPDSVTKPRELDTHPLVELAVRLIGELNAKYASERNGSFMLLHRHRIFNKRQGVWMSWERKRGKLLDLNRLLSGESDAFPIKAGRIDLLHGIRYILTLDADTQLPRGAAAQLAGAMAHPLNRAVIDPKLRIVTMGYGILQPRVSVAVRSAERSRLAAMFSGQSGFDIYTHATSDAYQDLFGEGIFAGKGIYEVSTFQAVLNHRFPRNALLSHDLIEGAYARAGLVSDVRLIDDYPSHYSAYNRRQHRWIRGDWQIAQWMFSIVPDEAGRLGPNPITAISRWKIFDNLRRSLVEPALLMLFAAGWLGLPGGALYWTTVTLCLMFFPAVVPPLFVIAHAFSGGHKGQYREALAALGRAITVTILRLILLLHQTMLIGDAVFRSLFRRFITGERLLEWETAAQAESQSSPRAPVDRYLAAVFLVVFALAAAIKLFSSRHNALLYAAPFLAAWALSSFVAAWLDRSPHARCHLDRANTEFLEGHALRAWRYFCEFSSARHNFLIPDNVEEDGLSEAARVSPTNIGMLLNARQAACELGFLTVPEFVALTQNTLASIARLDKFRGHLYNWYDTQTLRPLGASPFISSVDSGNFAASLYTLQAGVRALRRKPLLNTCLFAGLRAHWRMMSVEGSLPPELRCGAFPDASASASVWIGWLAAAEAALSGGVASQAADRESAWWINETLRRVTAIRTLLRAYLPWMLEEYRPLDEQLKLSGDEVHEQLSVDGALLFCEALLLRIADASSSLAADPALHALAETLRASLFAASGNLRALTTSLREIEHGAERLAEEMDFAFLVNPRRQILSIGYNSGEQRIEEACYDLFASEARMATFLTIARGDLQLQSWFKLEREHTYAFGRFVLLSWTGTMFEYLMPALWMRSYRYTLAAQTESAAVHAQRAFARALRIPWGISESGKARRDDAGHYGYHAHGVPQIAVSQEATAGPVVAPYATFLALRVDSREALRNLRRMESSGWVGAYGFYEAADYSDSPRTPELVREWMAHHQGMTLLAITNRLCDDVFPQWFHSTPLVQAVELLLHEMPVSNAALKARQKKMVPAYST